MPHEHQPSPLLFTATQRNPTTGQVLVHVRIGEDGEGTRMLPARVREFAARLFDAAAEAEAEEVLRDLLINHVHLKPHAARAAIGEFRLFLEKRRAAKTLRGNDRDPQ